MFVQDDNEEELELADQIASCLTVVLRNKRDEAMALVDPLMPLLGALMDAGRAPEERRIGICVLDDIIEHSPAGKPQGYCLPMLLFSCVPPSSVVFMARFSGWDGAWDMSKSQCLNPI